MHSTTLSGSVVIISQASSRNNLPQHTVLLSVDIERQTPTSTLCSLGNVARTFDSREPLFAHQQTNVVDGTIATTRLSANERH